MEAERRVKEEQSMGGGKLEVILRVLAFVLTLAAAIVVGADKQTTVVPVTISSNLPPLDLVLPAKWHYLSAFVYLFATNVIACSYGLLMLIIILTNNTRKKALALLVIILDTVMVALLSSGSGAAAAIGYIGYHGNSHVQWNKVCNIYGRFCKQVGASTVLSLVGAVVFMFLIVLAAVGLQKRPK